MPTKVKNKDWKCPHCGQDIEEVCKKYIFDKYSEPHKEYWRNPTPGHRENTRKGIRKAQKVANADPKVCRERGKALFKTVPRETRLEYLARAQAAFANNRDAIIEQIKQNPNFQERMKSFHDANRIAFAKKRIAAIKASTAVSHDLPIFQFRFNRAKVSDIFNFRTAGDVIRRIGQVRQSVGSEVFAIWDEGLQAASVYITIKGAKSVVGDAVGVDESFCDYFPVTIEETK